MFHISNVISRIFGLFASVKFPKKIQSFINKKYVKILKLDMSEFQEPESYSSLNELFRRGFKNKRKIVKNKKILLSMCDSLISATGKIASRNFEAFQIKGFSYSVNSLLGDFVSWRDKDRLKGGVFINFYLSPADYHRYHAPCDMKILKATHVVGKLYPVNFTWLNKKAALFTENERVILECETTHGYRFYLVYVGALNVGKMKFYFDETICTNRKSSSDNFHAYLNVFIKQGEEMGYFEMGSTIVFLGEKGYFKSLVRTGRKVKFGDKIISLVQ